MKRDMDYIRELLLRIEEQLEPIQAGQLDDQHHSDNELYYHLKLLYDAGFITGEHGLISGGNFYFSGIELTWIGHEFLDAAREPLRWEQAKGIANKAGVTALSIMKDILVQLGAEAVKKVMLGG
ncbi:MAG: DUF2513 domain-containing protein [Armatimonadota bacterium]